MARIRTIKPDFFTSEDVVELPLRTRLTWIGLWTHCDDHGRAKANLKLIKAAVWPLDPVSLKDIEADLNTLADRGRIVVYEVGGARYLVVVNWHHHQSINRPSRPKHPGPPMATAPADPEEPGHCKSCCSPNAHATITEPNVNTFADRTPGPESHGTLTEDSVNQPEGANNGNYAVSAAQPAHASLTESSVSPHGGLTSGKEGNREGKGRDARARESRAADPVAGPGPEPSRNCPQHENDPEPPPCGACADARRRWEIWDVTYRRFVAEQRSAEAKAQADARRLEISNCDLCDKQGYLPSGRQCQHDPSRINGSSQGAAAARAAVRKLPSRPDPIRRNARADLDAAVAGLPHQTEEENP